MIKVRLSDPCGLPESRFPDKGPSKPESKRLSPLRSMLRWQKDLLACVQVSVGKLAFYKGEVSVPRNPLKTESSRIATFASSVVCWSLPCKANSLSAGDDRQRRMTQSRCNLWIRSIFRMLNLLGDYRRQHTCFIQMMRPFAEEALCDFSYCQLRLYLSS